MKLRTYIFLALVGIIPVAVWGGAFFVQSQERQLERDFQELVKDEPFFETLSASVPEETHVVESEPVVPAESRPTLENQTEENHWSEFINEKNAIWSDHTEWGDIQHRNFWTRHFRDWPESDVIYALNLYREEQPFIKRLHDAICKGGPVTDFDSLRFFDVWPARRVMELARVLNLEALIEAALGNDEQALSAIFAGLDLGDLLVENPKANSYFYGIRHEIYSLMIEAVQEAYPPGRLDAEASNTIIDRLTDITDYDAFMNAQIRDHSQMIVEDRKQIEKLMSVEYLESQLGKNEVGWSHDAMTMVEWTAVRVAGRFVNNNRKKHYVNCVRILKRARPGPYYQVKPVFDRYDEIYFDHYTFQYQAQTEARAELTRIGLLTEGYFAENGRYPDDLKTLSDSYNIKFSRDPFDGQPYKYLLDENPPVIYSVGKGGVDRQGTHVEPRGLRRMESQNIVWRGPNYYEAPHPNAASDTRWQEILNTR